MISVLDFDVRPDNPRFDNTPGFQQALDLAASSGGETVVFPHAKFRFDGHLTVGQGVVFRGETPGPFDPIVSHYPDVKTVAPTLLPRERTGAPFITLEGSSAAVEDFLVYYPEQIKRDQPVPQHGPTQFPVTIQVRDTGRVSRITLANSYKGIEVRNGRVNIEKCNLGCYAYDILVDNAKDIVRISDCTLSIFTGQHLEFGQPLDLWTLNNGTGIISRLCDQLHLSDLLIFGRQVGIKFEDPLVPEHSTDGCGSNIDLDTVRNGIVAQSTNRRVGFTFSNVHFGPYWDNPGYAIWLQAGAPIEYPRVAVVGGSIRHQWASGNWPRPGTGFQVDAGQLVVRSLIGHDILPRL